MDDQSPRPPASGGEIRFMLSEADLVEAHRTNYWASLKTRRFLVSILAFVGLVLAAGYTNDGIEGLIRFGGLIVGGLAVFFALMSWVQIPRQTRALLRDDRRFHGPWTIGLAPDALHLRNSQGDSRYLWTGFTSWRRGKHVLMLTTAPQMFVPIPIRDLPDGSLAEIEAHLSRAGVPRIG